MHIERRRLLTIVTEATLEHRLIKDIERLGAQGYTITDVRGKGARGVRESRWEGGSNIRVEIACDAAKADVIAAHLKECYDDFAMFLCISDVEVVRSEKL